MCALHFSWNFGQIVLWFEIDVTQFDGNEYGDKNGNTYTHIPTHICGNMLHGSTPATHS